jgi:hypothetical protein
VARTNRESAKLGFIFLAIFVRRVSERNQLRLFFGKQLDNLLPRFLILLSEQLPAEVLNVHLRDVHTLVHSDLALRWPGRKTVTLMNEKIKRPLFEEKYVTSERTTLPNCGRARRWYRDRRSQTTGRRVP